MFGNLIDHLDNSLTECEGFSQPFEVRYFSPFPNDLYQAVLENLPADNCYEDLQHEDAMRPDGSSTRKVMLINKFSPPFWREMHSVLCSKKVEEIFKRHLNFEGGCVPTCRLLRDFAGYKILPHPDSSKKRCTVQFYLPDDDEQSALGTSFYSRNGDGLFIEEQKLKFLPNTGYCFKVTQTSWHGCDFQVLDRPRNTLILTYYRAKQ